MVYKHAISTVVPVDGNAPPPARRV
jgi:sRNA-binding regulator protein Hfq